VPELADMRVLRTLGSAVDDTVRRAPITLRDALTFRLGMGAIMAAAGTYPIQAAIAKPTWAGPLLRGLRHRRMAATVRELPLLHQPGAAWTYHTGSDLVSSWYRVHPTCVRQVPGRAAVRSPRHEGHGLLCAGETSWTGSLSLYGDATSGGFKFSTPRAGGNASSRRHSFPAATGLVRPPTTILPLPDDVMRAPRKALNLSARVRELMTTDHLTTNQKAFFFSPFYPGFLGCQGWGSMP